jgi:hypothetical protein
LVQVAATPEVVPLELEVLAVPLELEVVELLEEEELEDELLLDVELEDVLDDELVDEVPVLLCDPPVVPMLPEVVAPDAFVQTSPVIQAGVQ